MRRFSSHCDIHLVEKRQRPNWRQGRHHTEPRVLNRGKLKFHYCLPVLEPFLVGRTNTPSTYEAGNYYGIELRRECSL